MKIIAIGDTHATNHWEKVLDVEKDFDKFVFIGDYFDTFKPINAVEQIYNFQKIVRLKKDEPDRFILLIGNHDQSYVRGGYPCSGYQYEKRYDIQDVIEENMEYLQAAYQVDNILFTHAGVTKTWCKNNDIQPDHDTNVAVQVNNLYDRIRHPFNFGGGAKLRFSERSNPYGDDLYQGCMWVRPNSLYKDCVDGYIQVVGHTHQPTINSDAIKEGNTELWYIDILDTKLQYLEIIIDGEGNKTFNIKELPNIEF